MKSTLFCVVLLAVLFSSSAGRALTPEFRVAFDYYSPSDDDAWDKGLGGEAQLVLWTSPEIGLALAGGVAEWEAEEYVFYDAGFDYESTTFIDGDARLIPLGISGLFRQDVGRLELTLEAGVRYIFIDSNIDARTNLLSLEFYDLVEAEDEIEMDDAVVGRISIDVGYPVSENVKVLAGIGYQVDIAEADVTVLDMDIGEAEFEAFFLRFGLGFLF